MVKHEQGPPLQAPIERIFYLSREGRDSEHEVHPVPNPVVLEELETCDAMVYGMGSLYTSICPSLVLEVRSAANSLICSHAGNLEAMIPYRLASRPAGGRGPPVSGPCSVLMVSCSELSTTTGQLVGVGSAHDACP